MSSALSCINRNIVECKVARTGISMAFTGVLIETLWNVKVLSNTYILLDDSVLIETLWNVKLGIHLHIRSAIWY